MTMHVMENANSLRTNNLLPMVAYFYNETRTKQKLLGDATNTRISIGFIR